ncbi:MAG: PBSX family phage terminase large subunit, partial [Methylococcales bacterium]|nr:PBSX family phage terminase large subunit [Methylococcales bacterium]
MKVDVTPAWLPFLEPHRYKIAYGGRGSGKSWTIAALLVAEACSRPIRILCAREIQRSISDSVLQLLDDTIQRLGAGSFFEVQRTQILGQNGSRFLFEGLRSNVTKIKSMEGIHRVWVEEAESVTRSSWETLIPTVRAQGSEIWCSFNPLDELADTYQRFCVQTPPDTALIKVNWQDNPFFPPELDRERLHMQTKNKDLYQHIWEGDCLSNRDGAYYAQYINDEQIMPILPEPSIPVITSFDLGIGDSTAIWFIQPFMQEFRVIHSYENSGEGLQHYVNYLHDYRAKTGIVYGD